MLTPVTKDEALAGALGKFLRDSYDFEKMLATKMLNMTKEEWNLVKKFLVDISAFKEV